MLSDNPGTTGSPALSADGTVLYVATASNFLAAFNTASGGLRWSLSLANGAAGSVVVAAAPSVGADGSVLLGAMDGYIRSVASNGNSRWAFATGTVNANTASGLAPSTALSPDGTAVYAGGEDNTFYALNASNGNQLWAIVRAALPARSCSPARR